MHYVCEKTVGLKPACDFRRIGKIILQQPIERAQAQRLLAAGKTDLLPKFVSKKGRPFKAFLVVKDGAVEFEFEAREGKTKARAQRTDKPKEPAGKIDFTGQEPLGKCPKCGGGVFETEEAFVCGNSQAEKRPCKFKVGKVILQQTVDRAQAAKLLAEGRTDLLTQFVSKKTGRPFSAYLVVTDDEKVGFDFPAREVESEKSHAE